MIGFPGHFTPEQHTQLLQPINPRRVLKDGKGMSHVSQQDVVAHLTRIFGFGNWGYEVLSLDCVFEQGRDDKGLKYDVAYRALVRLTIYDANHNHVTIFEDASIGQGPNLKRADAHDLAMKSAISTALKRCAKNLGDQFGLSLYNKGQQTALVKGSLVMPEAEEVEPVPDVQEGIEQQVSLGHDEVEHPTPETTDEQEQMLASALGAQRVEEPVAEERADWGEAATPEPEPSPEPESVTLITDAQSRKMGVLMKALDITTREAALDTVTAIIERQVASRNELTRDEASTVLDALDARMKEKADQ